MEDEEKDKPSAVSSQPSAPGREVVHEPTPAAPAPTEDRGPRTEDEPSAVSSQPSAPTEDRGPRTEDPRSSEGAAASAAPSQTTPPPPPPPKKKPSLAERLREPEEVAIEVPLSTARARTRRDFLLFGLGAIAAAGGVWWLLPDDTRELHLTEALRERIDSLEARLGATGARRERFLNRALTFDDDVAEALYSKTRTVRTYAKLQAEPLRNNYAGATPGPGYLPGWTLALGGLASGRPESLSIGDLLGRFRTRDQVTRVCCVEGWSAVAWWGGFPFGELLAAFPPAADARWAKLTSSVNLDGGGRPDPYYVSIDLETARHPQALLATHHSGKPLPLAHGAPLRLVVPMKLGLKNIKAITSIEYTVEQPADYWNERGYSKYDGL